MSGLTFEKLFKNSLNEDSNFYNYNNTRHIIEEEEKINVPLTRKHSYSDFQTINWFRDLTIPSNKGLVKNFFKKACLSVSGWIAVTLVGVMMGIYTYMIISSTNSLLDLRLGYCPGNRLSSEKDCNWLHEMIKSDEKMSYRWKSYETHFIEQGYTKKVSKSLSAIIFCVLSISFAAISAWMCVELSPYCVNSGIAEIKTILNGFVIHKYLGLYNCIIKGLVIVLSVSSNLNIGYESTLLHIGACFGNCISRVFPKYRRSEAKKREIISAGVASGISSAFNAPISGLLFSFEEACRYFSFKTLWRTFWCTLISALVCYHLASPAASLKTIFKVSFSPTFKMFEIIPLIIIAIIGGLFGSFFIYLFSLICRLRKNSIIGDYPITEVTFVALIISLISLNIPMLKISNHQLMKLVYGDCSYEFAIPSSLCVKIQNTTINTANHVGSLNEVYDEIQSLFVIFLVKLIFLIFSSSLKLPNGYIFPLMTMGGIFGRMIGNITKFLWLKYPHFYIFKHFCFSQDDKRPCINTSLYALIGSAAFMAGATHMSVTLVVIMIELTDGAVFIVPIMIAVFIAKSVSQIFTKINIFEHSCFINKYPFIDTSILNKRQAGTAEDVITFKRLRSTATSLLTLTLEPIKLNDLYKIFNFSYYSYPLLESSTSPILVGAIISHELYLAVKNIKLTDYVYQSVRVTFVENYQPVNDSELHYINLSHLVDHSPYQVSPNISVYVLVQVFKSLGLHCVYVTDKGKFVDLITIKDLINYIRTT